MKFDFILPIAIVVLVIIIIVGYLFSAMALGNITTSNAMIFFVLAPSLLVLSLLRLVWIFGKQKDKFFGICLFLLIIAILYLLWGVFVYIMCCNWPLLT